MAPAAPLYTTHHLGSVASSGSWVREDGGGSEASGWVDAEDLNQVVVTRWQLVTTRLIRRTARQEFANPARSTP